MQPADSDLRVGIRRLIWVVAGQMRTCLDWRKYHASAQIIIKALLMQCRILTYRKKKKHFAILLTGWPHFHPWRGDWCWCHLHFISGGFNELLQVTAHKKFYFFFCLLQVIFKFPYFVGHICHGPRAEPGKNWPDAPSCGVSKNLTE